MPDEAAVVETGLREISDSFITELEGLLALEERKRSMAVDDPAFPDLARSVEDAARVLLSKASEQTSAATQAHDIAVVEGETATIEDMSPDTTPSQILKMWRDADRDLAQATQGSAEWTRLAARCDALRHAYQRAYERKS